MKKLLAAWLCSGLLAAFSACNSGGSIETAGEQNNLRLREMGMQERQADARFMVEQASSGMLHAQLSQMAAERAILQEVKRFGRRLHQDHSRIHNSLEELAAQKNLVLPYTIGRKDQNLFNEIGAKSDLEFDKAYMQGIADNLEACIKAYEQIAREGKDPDVKSFASSTIPTLKLHLDMAQKLNKRVASL